MKKLFMFKRMTLSYRDTIQIPCKYNSRGWASFLLDFIYYFILYILFISLYILFWLILFGILSQYVGFSFSSHMILPLPLLPITLVLAGL